jgi:hypothetical protein
MGDPRIFKIGDHREGRTLAAARLRARSDQLEVMAEAAFEKGDRERFERIMDRVDDLRDKADLLEP